MTTTFQTQAAAEAAIASAIAKGRIVSGSAQVTFAGPGGSTGYRAHCVGSAGISFCL